MISIDEAVKTVLAEAHPLPAINIPLVEAFGYVLAEPVHADMDVPAFDRAMMDGYALAASESANGKEMPVVAEIPAGEYHAGKIPSGHLAKIMTGAPLPEGCDAVIPVEYTENTEEGRVRLKAMVKPGENVACRGEEIKRGQKLLSRGTQIDPPVAAVLAQAGKSIVSVHRRPTVGILVTGTELVDPDESPVGGKIRESNSYGLIVQCLSWGGSPTRLGRAGDDPILLKKAIEAGLEYDILAITGGVSMGDYDLVPDLVSELGVRILFHKVAQKPAKPILVGKTDSTMVFGLPGNPVACFLGFELYAGPAIRRLAGEENFQTEWLEGVAAGDFKIKSDRANLKHARVERNGSVWTVHPVQSRGSADIFSVTGTNAFVRFDEGRYTVPSGDNVTFFFYRGKAHGA